MTDGTSLIWMIVLPFVGSAIAALLPANARNAEAWLAGLVTLAVLGMASASYPVVAASGAIRHTIEWVPSLGLNLSLRMDGFAWLFVMMISGIGFLVVLYARYYMSPDDPVPRFFSFFLAFMGAMLGIVLSGNLILLVVFWELTSVFSFLLIGYWHHNANARDGARMALTITGIGGLGLLAGMLLLGHIVGSYDLDRVLASGDVIRSHDLYVPALLLILLGTLTKSAQFPFHFWLPNAMAAPTPVSAYLHSATMVKAGVFLMARLWPVLAGSTEWFWILGFCGMMSLALGAYFAIFQQDIKGLLAYSTISHLGLITLLLSLGSPLGAVAAIFHMVNHATFKASLFMAAGIIDHETGTRDIRRLSGLFRFMPITATLAMVASGAMAGVPLLNGFLSKEMFFAEAIETHAISVLDTAAPYVAVLASAFAVTYSIRFIHGVFFGPLPTDLARVPHEPPFLMRFPIMLLVLACILVGTIPGMTIGPFLHTAVSSVLGSETPQYSLSVWHGFNLPLMMSTIALVAGGILYLCLKNYLATCEEGPPIFRRLKGQRVFERAMVTVSWRWARFVEFRLGARRLQPQLRLLVFVAFAAAFWPLYSLGFGVGRLSLLGADPAFAGVWVLGMLCAIGAAYQAKFHRLAALVLLSGAGLVTCITFVWLSAPDLAVTQLLVEIVTTVLILLGLRWLPKRVEDADALAAASRGARLRRLRDLALAVAAGLGVTVIAYAVMSRTPPATIADYFLEKAYSEGGGRNVVNVILVDFRGFDTFGEITVLGIVALTVFALLRRFRPASDNVGSPEQQRIQTAFDEAQPDRQVGDTASDWLMIPAVIMQWLFPVIIVFAAYLFLRGHDLPGGGFAAGIAMAAAFILQYMAAGTRWVEDRLKVLPVRWIGAGLLMAAITGAGSWLFGYPFLTSHSRYVDLPLIGEVPLASALFFDLGVFSLVVGATVLMLIALAHQSIRRHRVRTASAVVEEKA
ncbi:multisubunit potassium/proton antiporter PhaA subunit /multisubunit potassium/proton antiporter PhaB subunit [Aminobacter aminovorans]|jgi:multicomponent K+:H+ antiporter subunit A|uniref:Multiple resistance and pH homeostasis protein A n=1 Tax=Aminobacter aminovorans TaxID=83263 RepID=A0A381IKA9_AMIAI|nr:monovalent cation/H+ antiporter subunit A [Aminobacter aminovorans]TCS24914.1 multisubunit potassium/proton antiporter PhaA subunit /multisubunit potassium/proton antiporter PhaB subunit [Aminobacter aminovorans]SUY28686.1 Multiple resistance and pH homeostasis protein A [Aminobacter aminovorans]